MLYSSYKAAHHLDRIIQLRNGELIAPTQVQIDLTNTCNHKCPYCFYRCAKNSTLNALFDEKDVIPTSRMLKLLDELKETGVNAIQYTGGGEPMMHSDYPLILSETVKRGFDWALVTNGCQRPVSESLDAYKTATWIRVSMDAATPETHAKSQGTDIKDFDRAVKFMRDLVSQCPNVTVGMSFVVNPINYKEIYEAAKLAKEIGCSNIRFSVAYTPRGIDLYREKWAEIGEIAQRAKHLQTSNRSTSEKELTRNKQTGSSSSSNCPNGSCESCGEKAIRTEATAGETDNEGRAFRVFDLINAHLENLDLLQKGYESCGYQHFTAVIGADQRVYPCCTLKYNAAGTAFGDLSKHSFKEIWYGEKRKSWLKMDHLKLVCDKNPCWMDKKNEFISYLIGKEQPHVNYI